MYPMVRKVGMTTLVLIALAIAPTTLFVAALQSGGAKVGSVATAHR
ncbi:unannotated protein [freshwater metagenome]|uniref:Unannotated protein n=1 Tax=freshwater metagenome TaxID=449393 RepID=A0A6J6PYI8_9ZZZZ